jgi:hypothetical protein
MDIMEMKHHNCPTCLDLDFDLFKQEHVFMTTSNNTFARYRAINFANLRATASTGCPYCIVLQQATEMFWGNKPEGFRSNSKRLLVLEIRRGKGLIALRSLQEFPDMGIRSMTLRLELFTPDCKVPRNTADYKPNRTFRWKKYSPYVWTGLYRATIP